MTVQAKEKLEYRDEKYSLIGEPLQPYLENNREIEFEIFSTSNWRGYQGYWLLKSDNLYLTNIESYNYTMSDLFKSEEPVLAEWFSGHLEFGIGKFYIDNCRDNYNNYIWLNIEMGKVIDKKVIKRFDEEPEFTFGKYKGKKIEDVLNGKIKRNTYITIKYFISCLLEFIVYKDYGFKVQCPHFEVTQKDVELVSEIRNYGIEYFLTQNCIAISSKDLLENSLKDERASKFSNLLEKILSSDFTKSFILTTQDLEIAEIAEHTVLVNGDLQYLILTLRTVEFFSIPPNILEKEFLLKRLKKLNINRLNNCVFEYEPILETFKYMFSEHIIMINREKFEKTYKVKYDFENNLYTSNLNKKELVNKFGHYLDENHIEQEIVYFDNHQNIFIDDHDNSIFSLKDEAETTIQKL